MRREDVPDLDDLLRQEGEIPIPEPRPDLVSRTIGRVRDMILVGDLLRLVTLDWVWRSLNRGDGDARPHEERQDS